MKFKTTKVMPPTAEILANDDWAGMPHTFTVDAMAGDIVGAAGAEMGVCLYDVDVEYNPNGTVVYRGCIDMRRIKDNQRPTSAQVAKLPQIIWLNEDNTHFTGTGAI